MFTILTDHTREVERADECSTWNIWSYRDDGCSLSCLFIAAASLLIWAGVAILIWELVT